MKASALISVVDDDVSIRESLPALLQVLGYETRVFASAAEFLESDAVGKTDCLILDAELPDATGPELHAELRRLPTSTPVVLITAGAGEEVRPELLRVGAIACLFKPFTDSALEEAIQRALAI